MLNKGQIVIIENIRYVVVRNDFVSRRHMGMARI